MRISSEVSFGILTAMPRYYYKCRGTYYMDKHDASRWTQMRVSASV
jgi:hypothetical protein